MQQKSSMLCIEVDVHFHISYEIYKQEVSQESMCSQRRTDGELRGCVEKKNVCVCRPSSLNCESTAKKLQRYFSRRERMRRLKTGSVYGSVRTKCIRHSFKTSLRGEDFQ